ncbi:Rhabdomeric opsin [Fasciola hepatica]|uniref:Rhabdomeric opsin n=1 Tax=Fasciola hepatica TaxID=6192 RepID=A0A4E0RXQ3_FASHE|nr:Rhabdomeric opsin [Fasciola hepatica]
MGVNLTFLLHYGMQKDVLDFMVPQWYNQTVPDPMYFYFVGVYVTVIGLVGVIGNLFVIVIFSCVKSLRTPKNMLAINLAISDLAFSAVNGFPVKSIASFNQRWGWSKFMCDFYGYTSGLFGFASLTTMMMISVERYCAIVWYDEISLQLDRRKIYILILCIWIWSSIWPFAPAVGIGRFVLEGFHTSCTFDYISNDWPNLFFNGGLYVFGFACPVMVIVFCYFQIVRFVRKNEREMVKINKKETVTTNKHTPGYRKVDIEAAKSATILVALFLMSWSPYAIVCGTTLLGFQKELNPFLTELPGLFAKNSAIYNPFVYIIKSSGFRRKLWQRFSFFRWCLPKRKIRRTVTLMSKITMEPLKTATDYLRTRHSSFSRSDSSTPSSCSQKSSADEIKLVRMESDPQKTNIPTSSFID